jgi:hypothetical protein
MSDMIAGAQIVKRKNRSPRRFRRRSQEKSGKVAATGPPISGFHAIERLGRLQRKVKQSAVSRDGDFVAPHAPAERTFGAVGSPIDSSDRSVRRRKCLQQADFADGFF